MRFDKHATREEAEARIRELGNEVFFGKPFEAVAKQSSEGYTASDGGVYDWTTQGSLKSKELDHAAVRPHAWRPAKSSKTTLDYTSSECSNAKRGTSKISRRHKLNCVNRYPKSVATRKCASAIALWIALRSGPCGPKTSPVVAHYRKL
ncbi:MAG: peptidylprolyl isomerase [Pirellulaceae bacterium]